MTTPSVAFPFNAATCRFVEMLMSPNPQENDDKRVARELALATVALAPEPKSQAIEDGVLRQIWEMNYDGKANYRVILEVGSPGNYPPRMSGLQMRYVLEADGGKMLLQAECSLRGPADRWSALGSVRDLPRHEQIRDDIYRSNVRGRASNILVPAGC